MDSNQFEDQQKAEHLLGLFESLSKQDKGRIIGILVSRTNSDRGSNEMEIKL